MLNKTLMAAAASAAMVVAAPALAQGRGGGGGGGAGGPPAGAGSMGAMNSQGPNNASPTGIMNASPNSVLSTGTQTQPSTNKTTDTNTRTGTSYNSNSPAATRSQGPQHASPNGISHANQNSVLARGAVSSTTLPGLTTGLTVNSSSGTSIGTVSRVVTGSDGSIRQVIVTGTNGQTYRLAPSTLTISGGVVMTTSTTVGG